MSDITRARKALVARILEGDGRATHAQRRAAFDNTGFAAPLNTLIDKVANRACAVTDEDIAAAKKSGLSEDQIFEMVGRTPQSRRWRIRMTQRSPRPFPLSKPQLPDFRRCR